MFYLLDLKTKCVCAPLLDWFEGAVSSWLVFDYSDHSNHKQSFFHNRALGSLKASYQCPSFTKSIIWHSFIILVEYKMGENIFLW